MQHTPARMGKRGFFRAGLGRLTDYVRSLLAAEDEQGEGRADPVLARILLIFVIAQLAGALWDLPGDHGWENDGIAPRGLFSGLAGNLTPGSAYRYPLLHFVLSLIVSLPALLLTPFVAGGLEGKALYAAGQSAVVMTGISLAVKALTIAMGTLAVLALAAFARRTVDLRAARLTALFCALNMSFAFYARSSNLDVPYLAWAALLLERLSLSDRGSPEERVRRYVQMGVLGAAAVATKDQAYAVVFPLFAIACVQALRERAFPLVLRLGASAAVSYAVLSGALFNPTGFLARLELLRGPNSQDWKVYDDTSLGLWRNVLDLAHKIPGWWWPWPVLILVGFGLLLCLVWAVRDRDFAPLFPLWMGLGSLLLFTLVVRRSEPRFVLPLAFVASYYAGVGAGALLNAARDRGAVLTLRAGLVLVCIVSALRSGALLATQWDDGRREVARWLAERPPGTRVETYGLPVYLPHFWLGEDAPYRVTRLQPRTGKPFAPMPGIEDVRDRYANVGARKPDVLVIPEGFVSRYLEAELAPGQRISEQLRRAQSDQDATDFMRRALRGELPGYELAFVAQAELPGFLRALGYEPVRIHGSTGTRTWVFVRSDRG